MMGLFSLGLRRFQKSVRRVYYVPHCNYMYMAVLYFRTIIIKTKATSFMIQYAYATFFEIPLYVNPNVT